MVEEKYNGAIFHEYTNRVIPEFYSAEQKELFATDLKKYLLEVTAVIWRKEPHTKLELETMVGIGLE